MRIPLSELNGREFDVAIIGGGINGASAAQHLAAAGYSVALVEKNDYAWAASSRSSRVLHSGLRYFAPAKTLWEHVFKPGRFAGKIRSAIESMGAMGDIVGTMPERVQAMPLFMPIYKELPYRGWHVDIGVKALALFKRNNVSLVYDRYPAHSPDNPEICNHFRDPQDITAFVRFRDFQFVWPERICVDALMHARDHGAVIRNYTEAVGAERTPDDKWMLEVRDALAPEDSARFSARLVVNTAGIWVDGIARTAAGNNRPKRRIIAVKGIHILVRLPEEFRGQGVASINSEKESIFMLPWRDYHYIGPTETIYDGPYDDVRPEEDEIEFLIRESNRLLPSLGLTRSDVLLAWAGVRPITYDERYPKGRRLPFSVLHDLSEDGLENMIALSWGTVNLHRVSARHIMKAVKKKIRPSLQPRPLALGARRFPESHNSIAAFAQEPEITLSDLAHVAEKEDATNLVDVLYRRTHLGWHPELRRDEVHRAAVAVGGVLGWSKERIEAEVEDLVLYARERHRVEVK